MQLFNGDPIPQTPSSEVQSIIDQFRQDGYSDTQIEQRLGTEFAEDLWKPILYPENQTQGDPVPQATQDGGTDTETPEDGLYGMLVSRIGPQPSQDPDYQKPVFPEEAYAQYEYDFMNPALDPIMPIGLSASAQQKFRDDLNRRTADRRTRFNFQKGAFETYNAQLEQFQYDESSWFAAAEDIISDEQRELYESTIKKDEPFGTFLQIPERVNSYEWNSFLGDKRSTGELSPLDFGVLQFNELSDEQVEKEMMQSPQYVEALERPISENNKAWSVNMGSSNYPMIVTGSPDEVMNQVKGLYDMGKLDGNYVDDEVFRFALKEKLNRQDEYFSAYRKEWFTNFARNNVFDIDNMTPDQLAQAEEDIFTDTGLVINLDGNNVIGREKADDFWKSVDAGWMQTYAMGNSFMFHINSMIKAVDARLKETFGLPEDGYQAHLEGKMAERDAAIQRLDAQRAKIKEGMTKYYMTRGEAVMVPDDNSLDFEVDEQGFFGGWWDVFTGYVGIHDAFGKQEKMEAIESIPTSLTGQTIGAGLALATKGKGRGAGALGNTFSFLGRQSFGAALPMSAMVGSRKYYDIYDDPNFSTFTDSEGNQISPQDATLRLAQAKFEGDGTATYESLGITRDRNAAAILGYSYFHGGGEAAGELAGGAMFSSLGSYFRGAPLSNVTRKRWGQFLKAGLLASGIAIPEEYTEELITEGLQYYGETLFEGKEFDPAEFVRRVHKSGLSGATIGPFMAGGSSVISTSQQEYSFRKMNESEYDMYRLSYMFNGEVDRMGKDAQELMKLQMLLGQVADPAMKEQLEITISQLEQDINTKDRARIDKARALMNQDKDLANALYKNNVAIGQITTLLREAEEQGNEELSEVLNQNLEARMKHRDKLHDATTKALEQQRNLVIPDSNRDPVKTTVTETEPTTQERQELEGLASRRATPEVEAQQDALEEQFDLEYDSALDKDALVVIADELGVTFEQGQIDESKMQSGVMDFIRQMAPKLAAKNVEFTVYGSIEAYESDPAIAAYMGVHGESPAAYAIKNKDGQIERIIVDPRTSLADTQHEVGHAVLRAVYDDPVQRMSLVEKLLEMSNMKGNEVFKAWVDSTIITEGSTREGLAENDRAQEELIQNFFQGYLGGEWKVFKDSGKQIEINQSLKDRLAQGFWDVLAINNPAVRDLSITNSDGLIAVASKFRRFVAEDAEFVPTTEKVPTLDERQAARKRAPEQQRPEPTKQKTDPESLFKERPVEAPVKAQKPKAEEVEQQAPTPIGSPKQETESTEDYQARLEREADELLKGTEGIETSQDDALSQETEGFASKRRGPDFVAGKTIKGYYMSPSGYSDRVFTFKANDYGHFRNWVARITGNGAQPFDVIRYENEKGQFVPMRAPKPVYNRDGTKKQMKPVGVDTRPFKNKFFDAKRSIVQSRQDLEVDKRSRLNALKDFASQNGVDISEILDPNQTEFKMSEIEAAEVQVMAKVSEEPGRAYPLGGIRGEGFYQKAGRLTNRPLDPKDLDIYNKGRELGFAQKRRNPKPYNKDVEGVGKFRPSFNYEKAIDDGILRRSADAYDGVAEVKQQKGGGPVQATVVKYAGTINGKVTYKVGDKSVSININSGIFTPVAEAQKLEKQLGRTPNPSEVMAVSNTNKAKQSEVYDTLKYRLPVQAENQDVAIAFVKLLEQKNPLGSPEVFEGAFKLIDAAIANAPIEQRGEALLAVVKDINKILDSEYTGMQTIGQSEPTYDPQSNKMIPSKPIKQPTRKKGGRVFLQELTTEELGESTGLLNVDDSLLLDENNPERAYESFKRYFTKAGTRRLSFTVAKPFLERLFNSNHLSSKENKKLLGLPNTQEFLEPLLADEFKSANSKDGDIVGMILIDPKAAALRTDRAKDNPYPFGVTGAIETYIFDKFATEKEIKEMMEKVDPTAITGGVGSQSSGLTGLASKRRAGRIYHHGRGQWEKSTANNFGKTLSAIAIKLQDKYFDVIMLQDDVENYKGQRLEAGQDFDLALDLMYGKTRNSLENLETSLDMIKETMKEANITSDDLSDFLYALHVPERNAYVSQKNKDNPAGSGQTNAWAKETISRLDSPEMRKLAAYVHSIVDNTRKTMVQYGLETQEAIDTWTKLFENYVPLAGLATDEMDESNIAYPTGGAGMGVYGSTQKKIKGRKSEVKTNIVAQVVMQNAMVIQTARKNEALMHLYRLIQENPNSKVWGINNAQYPLTRLNEQGQQEGMSVAEMKMSPHTVAVRVNGKTEFLYFRDKNYANTLNGMTVERASIFTRGLNSLTGFMRNMLTVYDPNFMISNYARDIEAAAYNAMAEIEMEGGYIEGLSHQKFAKDLISNVYMSTKQLFGNAAFGKDMTPEFEQYVSEWSEDGGKTGWGYTKELGDIIAELEAASNESSSPETREFDIIMGSPKKFANFIEGINEAFEHSIRLAAYVSARKNGISRERAAQLSKNITVNFNRSGEWQFLNSVYLFFNAAMQGNARFLRSLYGLKDVRKENGELESWHKRVTVPQKIAFAVSSLSGLITLLNIAGSGVDPDDQELWYNKIPDYEKERNMIIMHRDGKNYSKIPLAYGYNVFNNLGTTLAETSTGNRDPWSGASFLLMSAFSSFSPIGFGQSKDFATYAGKAVSPTIIKPLVEIAANETYFGSQVYQDRLPFSTTPQSQLSFRSPEEVEEFFEWMNEATGGSKYRSGSLDVNPDKIWYLYEYYIGSAGRFVGNTGELATNMYEMSKNSYRMAAEEGLNYEGLKKLTSGFQSPNKIQLRPSSIPLVRKIYGEPSRYFDSDLYKKNTFEIQQLAKEMKEGPVPEKGRYVGVQELEALFKMVNKQLQDNRARRRNVREIEDRTKRINTLYLLDEQQRRMMAGFNYRYEQLRGAQEN